MAPRGPKPRPTHLKVVEGNPGKRKLNTKEVQPRAIIPTPPAQLVGEAAEEWDRMAQTLFNLGILTEVDRAALAAYCEAYGRWADALDAQAAIRKRDPENPSAGFVITTSTGNMIQHPLVGIVRRAGADMVRYAAEFGMTPSARVRLGSPDPSGEDPGDKFGDTLWKAPGGARK